MRFLDIIHDKPFQMSCFFFTRHLVVNDIANVIKISLKYALSVVFNNILHDINDIIEQFCS